jgi:hypothetical protein
MFKGRNQSNEGELLYIAHSPSTNQGYVLNVLTDMYNHRLDDEVTKLLKKKEKPKEY